MEQAAVIFIDSDNVYLKMVEAKNNEFKVIEDLQSPLKLGQDTFKKINIIIIEELCKIITGYLKIISEYQIKTIKAVATAALGQVDNKDFIINQINIKTGLEVEIIDNFEEKKYIYQAIINKINQEKNFWDSEALISYIGSGSLGIGIYAENNIIASRNIKIGSLKVSEILKGIQDKTDEFYVVVEESLSSITHSLKIFLEEFQLNNFIVTGKKIEVVANLCKVDRQGDFFYIPQLKFDSLYQEIKNKTPAQIENTYNLSENNAETILPSIVLYKTLMNLTSAEKIIAPIVFLTDIILYKMLYPDKFFSTKEKFYQSTVLSAKNLGKKYKYDQIHSNLVSKFALNIFDNIKKIHGLNKKHRLLLHSAAVLHDVGKYINISKHYQHSYRIIKSSNIFGLNHQKLSIVALITKYHSNKSIIINDQDFQKLNKKDRLVVAKLTAILRIADALNKSHYNKFNQIKSELTDDQLVITVLSNKETVLEEYTFQKKSKLFKEVFGIKLIFKKKVLY